jgi:hypothetical protein
MDLASTNVIMGTRLLANEPKLLGDLFTLRKGFPKLAMGLPKWMAKDVHVTREKIIRAFMKWGVDEEGMMIYIRKRNQELVGRGMDLRDVAVLNYGLWMA